MPTPVKHIFYFRSSEGYGWSETHFRNISDATIDLKAVADDARTNIVPKRVALLGEDCSFIGLRVSYPLTDEIASYNTDENIGSGNGKTGAASALSLVTTFVNVTYNRKSITHLRGFWDDLERDETFNPEPGVGAEWAAVFTQWKDALIARGYGWLSKNVPTSAKGLVNSYVEETDGTVKFLISANANITLRVGTNIAVRFARINNSKSTLNRTLVVRVNTANELQTVAPIATGAFSGKGIYTFRDTVFYGYANTGGLKIGKRQMGKPIGLSVARSKARART